MVAERPGALRLVSLALWASWGSSVKACCGLQPVLWPSLALASTLFCHAEAREERGQGFPVHAASAGAVAVGREDLLRVRTSLQRISDELHLILSVLDQQLDAPPVAYAPASEGHHDRDRDADVDAHHPDSVPLPREAASDDRPQEPPPDNATGTLLGPWTWAIWGWSCWAGIYALDIGIVVGMQVFLESIGRKRGGSSIMPKKGVAAAIATKAAGAPAPGAPIPAPSATPGRASSQRLSVLSQEELLAACLTEHWGKLAVGVGLAVAFRLPQHLLSGESLICHMIANFTVMLRCMSLVMLLVRDDMTLPKKEKPEKEAAPPPPPPPRRQRLMDSE